jgi:uncharacterized protein (DUF58 family)
MRRPRYSFFLPPEDHFFIKRAVVFTRMWFTDFGRILFAIGFISLMVSSPGLQISAYLLPSFILTLFATAFLFAFLSKPKVTAQRLLPPSPCAGEYLIYQVIVKNEGRRPIRDLTICEGALSYGLYDAPDHKDYSNTIAWLEPQDRATVTLVTRCKVRGVYELPLLLAGTSFPSGLLRWPLKVGKKDRVTVYPQFIPQTNFIVPFKRVYQPGGIAVSSHVGDSNEFLTIREYRRGDRLKDIHWASYARTGQLIVKEYVDEYFVRVGIFLDTELKRRQHPKIFEKRVSVVAGIADAIARKEYIIDLFAAGEDLHHFQMGRALAHLENLLELLAYIESVRFVNVKKLEANLNPFLQLLSAMIILLGDWDEARAQLCATIEQRGTQLRVIVVRDGPLTLKPDRPLTIVGAGDLERLIAADIR